MIAPIIGKKNDFSLTPLEIAQNDFIKCQLNLPAEYIIRQFQEKDFLQYYWFLFRVNMGHCPILYWKKFILPGGFFVVEEIKTGTIIGSEFVVRDPKATDDDIGTL